MQLQSSAFQDNHFIPAKYTCDESDMAPDLTWTHAPGNTKTFALIIDDPDAPGGTWDHLVMFNLPADLSGLPTGFTLPKGAVYGKNSWDKLGYGGPCPPRAHGVHRYIFTLYALDTTLALQAGVVKSDVLLAMEGHVLASAKLTGRYERR